MAHAKPSSASEYPQGWAGTAWSGGIEAPKGNKHVTLKPSGVQVDNGGLDGVFKKLVDEGFAVKPSTPTKRDEVEVFAKHKGQQQ